MGPLEDHFDSNNIRPLPKDEEWTIQPGNLLQNPGRTLGVGNLAVIELGPGPIPR